MWLLDVNMPKQLMVLLESQGIKTDTAAARGWGNLNNGALLEAAAAAGFRSILTRDRLFGESASRALRRFPEFSIVLITLPQLRAQRFLEAFQAAWSLAPIVPAPGELSVWPR
jgi:predicted nuclease of predicted toxin-antitoxin system